MANPGILRLVDKMGRVVIPKEMRTQLNIENERDGFEIFLEGDKIILKKYQPTCIFCNSNGESIKYEGHNICKECIEKMYEKRDTAVD